MSPLAILLIGFWVLGSLVVLVLAGLGFDDETRLYYSNAMQLVASFGGGISCLITAFKFPSSSPLRRVWLLIGAGLVAWFLAQLLFASYPLLNKGEETPAPYISDIGFLLTPLLIALALIVFKRGMNLSSGPIGGASAFAAMVLTAATGLYFNWSTITGEETLPAIVQTSYALFQPLMIGATVWVATCFRGGVIGSSWWIAVVGIVLYYSADLAYYALSNLSEYSTGSISDLGWILGFGLLGIAAFNVRQLTNRSA